MDDNIDNILVINLDRSRDRLLRISDELKSHGLTFTRIRAVDGFKDLEFVGRHVDRKKAVDEGDVLYDKFNNESHPYWPKGGWGRYGINLSGTDHHRVFVNGKYARKGSLGNWLSHIKCWEYIINNNLKQTLVLEDDSIFVPNLMERFKKEMPHLPADCTALLLGCVERKGGPCCPPEWGCRKESQSVPLVKHSMEVNEFFSKPGMPSHSSGYMITNEVAKILKERAYPIFGHIDGYTGHMFGNRIPPSKDAYTLKVLPSGSRKSEKIVSYCFNKPRLTRHGGDSKSTMNVFFKS